MTGEVAGNPTRAQIAAVVGGDQRLVLALEALFRQANNLIPADIETLEAAIAAALAAAEAAQALANLLKAPEYLVAALSAVLTNERILSGDTGVTVDFSAPGTAVISVDVLAILGYTPVDPDAPVHLTDTLDVDGAATLSGGLTVVGQTETDSLKINQTPTAGVVVQSHYITVDLNGVTYKLLAAT
jgi:hypothetical protein